MYMCVIKRQIMYVSCLHSQCGFQELKSSSSVTRTFIELYHWPLTTEKNSQAGVVAQWLREFVTLGENQNSVPNTHQAAHHTSCNSNSRESNTLFCLFRYLQAHAHGHTQTQICINVKNYCLEKLLGFVLCFFWDRASCYIALAYLEPTVECYFRK